MRNYLNESLEVNDSNIYLFLTEQFQMNSLHLTARKLAESYLGQNETFTSQVCFSHSYFLIR
jgi:hypothetical protein